MVRPPETAIVAAVLPAWWSGGCEPHILRPQIMLTQFMISEQ